MNKKGILGTGVIVVIIIGIILALLFFTSIATGFKLISILKDMPTWIWYALIALIAWKIIKGGKK